MAQTGIRSFSTASRYNPGARVFHWLVALMIGGMYLTDNMRESYERGSAERTWWLAAHATIGVSILGLTILRLIWRSINPRPAPVPGPWLMRLGAKLGHAALYGFTFCLPVTGFLRHASTGRDITLYGVTLASPFGKNDALHNLGEWLHNGAWTNILLALIGLHVTAALYHHVILKDGTLRRMI